MNQPTLTHLAPTCVRGIAPRRCEALGRYTLADLHAAFAAALARQQTRHSARRAPLAKNALQTV